MFYFPGQFDYMVSMQVEYDDYVYECEKEGITPLGPKEWYDKYCE